MCVVAAVYACGKSYYIIFIHVVVPWTNLCTECHVKTSLPLSLSLCKRSMMKDSGSAGLFTMSCSKSL